MRLIDADELERVFIGKHYGVNAIKYFINMQPTIDAMPVKHGHWEDENMDDQVIARCSVCNTWNTARTPFCPYCNASMDEEEE